jgi:lysozyme family protein
MSFDVSYERMLAHIEQGREVPQSWVQGFYQTQFWKPLQADALPPDIADALFNFAVNAGLQTAIKLAQLVAAVRADGVIGPKTMSALQKIDEQQFIALYTLARIKRYAEICNKDRTQQKFLLGWMNRTLTVL